MQDSWQGLYGNLEDKLMSMRCSPTVKTNLEIIFLIQRSIAVMKEHIEDGLVSLTHMLVFPLRQLN